MSTTPYEIRLLRDKIERLENKYAVLLATQVQILGRLKELEDKERET